MDKNEIQKRLQAVMDQMDEMLEAGLNDENRPEYDTIEEEAETLRADLTRLEKQESRRKWAGEKPASDNKPVIEMGDAPADKPVFRSLGENISAIINASAPGAGPDERLRAARITGNVPVLGGEKRATGMSEGTGAYGGFFLQTEYADNLLNPMFETGILTPRVRQHTITNPAADEVTFLVLDETDRGRGTRLGGLRLYTREEASTVTASKPKFREFTVKPKPVMGLCYTTEEQMQDTPQIVQLVEGYFQNEAGYEIDEYILNGDGGSEPLGISKQDALIAQAIETGQAADTVVSENFINAYARMPARNRANAIWTHPGDALPQIMQLSLDLGVSSVPLWIPGNSLANAPNDSILNKPLLELEQAPTVGDANDIMFIDPTQYMLVRKGGARTDLSMHVMFLYGEWVLRFMFRIGGDSWWSSAITPPNDGNTLGPFIGFAERA